ncbi:hypothetical protein IFR05_015530 [Cadophora sp. M221]|nr:hypothetical protein IFR05_015530 [Cadophora sp. M221]
MPQLHAEDIRDVIFVIAELAYNTMGMRGISRLKLINKHCSRLHSFSNIQVIRQRSRDIPWTSRWVGPIPYGKDRWASATKDFMHIRDVSSLVRSDYFASSMSFERKFKVPSTAHALAKIFRELPNVTSLQLGSPSQRKSSGRMRDLHERTTVTPFTLGSEKEINEALHVLPTSITQLCFYQTVAFSQPRFGSIANSSKFPLITSLDLFIEQGLTNQGEPKVEVNHTRDLLGRFPMTTVVSLHFFCIGSVPGTGGLGFCGPSKLHNVIGGSRWPMLRSFYLEGVTA